MRATYIILVAVIASVVISINAQSNGPAGILPAVFTVFGIGIPLNYAFPEVASNASVPQNTATPVKPVPAKLTVPEKLTVPANDTVPENFTKAANVTMPNNTTPVV